jgi:hypothetical protein
MKSQRITARLPPLLRIAQAQPRLWFEYLRYGEYLRTVFRNDSELVRVRRRMRDMNSFMFDWYMEKVRGLTLTAHKP